MTEQEAREFIRHVAKYLARHEHEEWANKLWAAVDRLIEASNERTKQDTWDESW